MEIINTDIPDVKVLVPQRFGDHRGFFSEVYSRRLLAEHGIDLEFVQDNQSLSATPGVLRGLHYQLPPKAQDKLVRVVRGAIRDVALDIRLDSPTFGKHVITEISAENWHQVLVPIGFAHGFVTLEPDTEVIYKVTADYAPELERGIMWNDPALGIDWGVSADAVILSERDKKHPQLSDATDLF
ncbi:MAG: dTDP-4-dehydrorhamnose 3,5-epimerase [Phycisphaerales bacterium]|nr:dTDP-4-dehydrorhamnose 3,5-epimerase [Phycisphaerales bacterium]